MPEAKRWPACLASSTLSSIAARAGMRSMMQNLKCAEAESDQDFRIELGVGVLEQGLNLVIEANLPAEYAEHQGRGQIAVGGRERVDGFAAEQIVRVGVAAFDGHEDLEGGFARRRNIRGAILRRGLAYAGLPGRCHRHRRPEARVRSEWVAAQELGGREALFAFELQFEEFEPGVAGAARRRGDGSRCATWPGSAKAEPSESLRGATAMRWTMSFLPSRVVKAPGQG